MSKQFEGHERKRKTEKLSANKGNQKDITTKCSVVLEFIWGIPQNLMHSFIASNYWEMTEILTVPCVTSY